ncbi:MAG: DUF4907 domain-containing protein [Chitinophagaceae bacterium]|nr:DUF4907 domain-containing protein [Chitinophagaceae bacterium]
MKKIITCILFCSVTSVYAQKLVPATNTNMLSSLQHTDPQHRFVFTATAFQHADHSWGYDVFADGKPLFHQEEMPGKPKGSGFATKEDALKVADFIIDLLNKPVRPAVAYPADLKAMHLL